MEQDFYKGRLVKRYGLSVLVPDESDRETIHRVIFDELGLFDEYIALEKAAVTPVAVGAAE